MRRTGAKLIKPVEVIIIPNAGAQILAIMEDQIDPLSNVFDDAADYFHDGNSVF
jgi:hypothetical protein